MPSTWIHVFSLCLSLSPPEFHANHRRISLQAPRSHQLPSATFRHTISEGRYLNIYYRRFACRSVWSTKSGKHLASSDPDVHTYVHDFSSLFLDSLSSLHLYLTPISVSNLPLPSCLTLCESTRYCRSHSVSLFLALCSICLLLSLPN